jgi:acyl carrier protein
LPAARSPGSAATVPAVLEQVRGAPAHRRRILLDEYVQSPVAQVLGQQAQTIPRGRGFAELGLDSLSAIELRARLQQDLGCRLPTTLAFDYPTVTALAHYLCHEALHLESNAETTVQHPAAATAVVPVLATRNHTERVPGTGHAQTDEQVLSTNQSHVPTDPLDNLSREDIVALLAQELSALEDEEKR